MRNTILFLLTFLTIPFVGHAQLNFSTPVKISMNAGAHAPVIHADRDGTIYASWFERNADIYFSKSTDGGNTFATPVRASRQVTTNMYTSMLQRAPEFALDTKGTIHLAWCEGRINNQSDVWYIRSTDKGITWTQPMSIMDADDSQKYSQDFSAIACDSLDNLYISYLDNRWLVRRSLDHYQMHMQRSTNSGMSWTNPIITNRLSVMDAGTCECCRQDIAVSPEGHVYIAFRTSQQLTSKLDDRSIFICRSWDKGMTWDSSIRCQLGTWNLTSCPTKGPHISLDKNENLFLAWNDDRDDSTKMNAYASLLPKGESKILPNRSMSWEAQSGTWPNTVISPSGTIAYAYMPSSGKNRFTYSSDGGNTWFSDQPLPGRSGEDQTLPSIAFSGENAYIAWQDEDADGILFSNIMGLNSKPALSQPASLIPSSLSAQSPLVLRWNKPASLGRGQFVWYTLDMPGVTFVPLPTRDTELTISTLPAGTYNYVITAYTLLDSARATGSFTIENLGVEPEATERAIVIPNPVSRGIASFELPNANGAVTASIINEAGAVVKTIVTEATAGHFALDLSDLSAGAYHVQLSTNSIRKIVSIVIQ